MRRTVVTLLVALLMSFAVALPPAGAAPDGVRPQTQMPSQQSTSDDGAGSPSIVPSPDQRGTNNIGGLVVGGALIGGWLLVGGLLYRQAQRRRAAEAPAAT